LLLRGVHYNIPK